MQRGRQALISTAGLGKEWGAEAESRATWTKGMGVWSSELGAGHMDGFARLLGVEKWCKDEGRRAALIWAALGMLSAILERGAL